MILQDLRISRPIETSRVRSPAHKRLSSHLENSDNENRLAIRVGFARQSNDTFRLRTGIDLTSIKCSTKWLRTRSSPRSLFNECQSACQRCPLASYFGMPGLPLVLRAKVRKAPYRVRKCERRHLITHCCQQTARISSSREYIRNGFPRPLYERLHCAISCWDTGKLCWAYEGGMTRLRKEVIDVMILLSNGPCSSISQQHLIVSMVDIGDDLLLKCLKSCLEMWVKNLLQVEVTNIT